MTILEFNDVALHQIRLLLDRSQTALQEGRTAHQDQAKAIIILIALFVERHLMTLYQGFSIRRSPQ